jgi:predicted peptidase
VRGTASSLDFAVAGRARRAGVWLPPGFDPTRRWPLLLALHGYGERGDDGEHLPHGIGLALRHFPERYPAVVVMPQCPLDLVWVKTSEPWADGHGDGRAHLDAALDAALAVLPVDPQQVALTGLSMGGFACFHWGAERADRFRSCVAVCGGGEPDRLGRLPDLPLWVVHGDADDVVDVEHSRRMVRALEAASARVRYTELHGAQHNSWDLTYAHPEVARFLTAAPLPEWPR